MVIVERAARKGRNLKTGEVIEIPAKRVVVLKVDRKVSELINAKQWRALTNGER
jgi:nucleoid DNA-binding protein